MDHQRRRQALGTDPLLSPSSADDEEEGDRERTRRGHGNEAERGASRRRPHAGEDPRHHHRGGVASQEDLGLGPHPFEPRASLGIFLEAVAQLGAPILGKLVEQVALEQPVWDPPVHGPTSCQIRARRWIRRRRLRTPETESPSSRATSSRVIPSTQWRTAASRSPSESRKESRPSRARARERDSGSSRAAMRWTSSSRGSSGFRFRLRIWLRQTLVAMRSRSAEGWFTSPPLGFCRRRTKVSCMASSANSSSRRSARQRRYTKGPYRR